MSIVDWLESSTLKVSKLHDLFNSCINIWVNNSAEVHWYENWHIITVCTLLMPGIDTVFESKTVLLFVPL